MRCALIQTESGKLFESGDPVVMGDGERGQKRSTPFRQDAGILTADAGCIWLVGN